MTVICFLFSILLLSRGWIVPVGDAIPDRRVRDLPRQRGGTPTGSHGRRAAEVADPRLREGMHFPPLARRKIPR